MIEIRSFRDIARLFFIFYNEFRLAVVVTVSVAVLGAFLLPSRFESEARLLVKPGRETSILPIEFGDRQTLVAPSTQRDPVVDEEKMLTGRPIIRKVAEYYLTQMEGQAPQGFWKTLKHHMKEAAGWVLDKLRSGLVSVGLSEDQTPVDRLVGKLEKAFEVTHAAGSNVMEVGFTWDDPYIAQQVVSKWIEFYQEERARALGDKSLYEFYESESRKLARQIAEDKNTLATLLMSIDGISSKEKLEAISNRLNKLNAERSEAIAEQSGLQKGVTSANQLAMGLPKEVTTLRELSLNPVRQDLLIKLNQMQVDRVEALKVYKSDAPQINDLDAAIDSLKAQIDLENHSIQNMENRAPNELFTTLRRNSLQSSTRVHELAARIAAYDNELAELKGDYQRILTMEPEISRLERTLAEAEKSHALYLSSLEKARIDRELDKSRISNIAVIEEATFSPARVFPKSLTILLAAFPAGIAVGFLVIYLSYLLDQRIHDGSSIETAFGVPTWCSIPDQRAEDSQTAIFDAAIYRFYSLLPRDRLANEGLTIGIASARHGEGVSFIAHAFLQVLADRKIGARIAVNESDVAKPGEVVLIEASALSSNRAAFLMLRNANLILLVVQAGQSTVPVIENALSILRTAFQKVDGVIVNRRSYEVPASLLARFENLKRAI